jgi:hypothetical protein
MRSVWVLSGAVVFVCAAASGQTNGPPSLSPLFTVPHPQLRAPGATVEPTAPASLFGGGVGVELQTKSSQPEASLFSSNHLDTAFEATTFTSREREFNLEMFHRLDAAGYFDRPAPPSDSAVIRWAEGTFRPEVVHLGKTTLTCSLITAIKRKNPLCLLNPIFLNFSW